MYNYITHFLWMCIDWRLNLVTRPPFPYIGQDKVLVGDMGLTLSSLSESSAMSGLRVVSIFWNLLFMSWW